MNRRYRPATLLKRITAFGIDMALWNTAYLAACRLLLGSGGVVPGEGFLAYTVTFWSALSIINTFLLVSFNGQTPHLGPAWFPWYTSPGCSALCRPASSSWPCWWWHRRSAYSLMT